MKAGWNFLVGCGWFAGVVVLGGGRCRLGRGVEVEGGVVVVLPALDDIGLFFWKILFHCSSNFYKVFFEEGWMGGWRLVSLIN